jgi:hypothetical protein
MAEYIDKVQAMNIIASGKNDNAYFGTTDKDWEVIDFLKTVPTANVVEREKIDKAITDAYRIRTDVLCSNNCYEPNEVLDIVDQITKLFEVI